MPAMQSALSLSIAAIGLLIGVSRWGNVISAFLSGFLSGLMGRKKFIVAGVILSSICMLLTSFTTNFWLILILQFIAGFGFGTYLPSALSILSELFPPETRGRYIGIHEVAAPAGFTVGPILGGLMLMLGAGWSGGLQIWIVPAVIILLSQLVLMRGCFLRLPQDAQASSKIGDALKLPSSWSINNYLLLIGSLVCHNAMFSLISMLPLYWTSELNVEVSNAAFIFGVIRVFGIFGQLGAGYLSDVFGRLKVMLAIHSLGSVALVFSAYLEFNPLLIVSLFISSTLFDAFMPVSFALISDLTPPMERSKMIGFTLAISRIFIALSPTIIGLLAESLGFKTAWMFPITLTFIGIPFLILLKGRLNS